MVWGYAMLLSPNKDETTVQGCHCPVDTALCVRKLLDIPRSWYVCVSAEVGEDPGNEVVARPSPSLLISYFV